MAVRLNSSKTSLRFTSLSLEKILRTQQNLSKPSPRIWNDYPPNNEDLNHNEVQILSLNHPILRILESFNGDLAEFNQIHTQLIVSNLFQHPLAASRFIKKLCANPYSIPRAVALFTHLEEPDAFICNTIIRAYVSSHDPDNAIGFYYGKMVTKCIAPNHYTFPLLAKICAELGSVSEGQKTRAKIVKYGLELDLFVRNSVIFMYSSFGVIGDAQKVFDANSNLDLVSWNSMINGYVKNGDVDVARMFFDEMPERDIVSWNSMIAGYVGVEDMEAAQELFGRMLVKDVVSWNSMIDGYARIGNVLVARELFDQMKGRNVVSWNTMFALYARNKDNHECLRLFDWMKDEGEVKPNEATLVSILTACANSGKLEKGKWIHASMHKTIAPDVLLSTALLTMYAKCSAMHFAKQVFDEMSERSVVSWNSMIMGYGMHGKGEKALEMFLEMEQSEETPNSATFVCVLSACSHAGMVLEGWWYFDLMQRVYKIEPKIEHYGCMVDLLGRAGLIKESEELLKEMPMAVAADIGAGRASLGALLSACETHSNFELGEVVGKRLIELEPENVGGYVLLSNIYAMEGKWDDVEKVRNMMKEKGVVKNAGFSLVEVSGSKQVCSYHKTSMVYSMLSELGAQIKLCGNSEDDQVILRSLPC